MKLTGSLSPALAQSWYDNNEVRSSLNFEVTTGVMFSASDNISAGPILSLGFNSPGTVIDSVQYEGWIETGISIAARFQLTKLLAATVQAGWLVGRYTETDLMLSGPQLAAGLMVTPSENVGIGPSVKAIFHQSDATVLFQLAFTFTSFNLTGGER